MTTMILLYALQFVLAAGLAMVLHEGGHWLAARAFGKTITFTWGWKPFTLKLFGKELALKVFRGTWEMPMDLTATQKKIVAIAGFGTEILASVVMAAVVLFGTPMVFGLIYSAVVLAHVLLYNRYAGEANDFKWF